MKRNTLSALIISILLASAMMSCKKDTLETTPLPPPPPDSTRHQAQPTQIDVSVYSWNDLGNGYYSSTLYDVVSRINTSHSTSIKVYLLASGYPVLLNRPITFNNGILTAELHETDVYIRYQSFSKTPPNMSVNIRIVAS
jgi:hypothetical protein